MPVYTASLIGALEDILIYTKGEDLSLADVFIKIFETKTEVDPKVPKNILKETFEKILPNYDDTKVYMSDVKKIFSWYNILIDKEIITEESIKSYKEALEEEKSKEKEEEEKEKEKEEETSETEA